MRWALDLPAADTVVLSCPEHDRPPPPAPRRHLVHAETCPSELPIEDLLDMVVASPALELRRPPGCSRTGADRPAELKALLEEMGHGERLQLVDLDKDLNEGFETRTRDARELPIGRRRLLTMLRPAHASQGPAESGARHVPTPSIVHGEAQQQVHVVEALRELHRQGASPGARGGAGPTRARRLVSEGCTACGTCVQACPTRALDLVRAPDAGVATLSFTASACIGCQRCVALCPVSALSTGEPLSWAELVDEPVSQTLESVPTRVCGRCRTEFGGSGDLCQVCALRAQNPFGSWTPPGYVAPHVYAPPEADSSAPGLQGHIGRDRRGDR